MSGHRLSSGAVLQMVQEDLVAHRAVIAPARLRVAVMRFEPFEGKTRTPRRDRIEASRISDLRAFTEVWTEQALTHAADVDAQLAAAPACHSRACPSPQPRFARDGAR